MFSVRNLKSRTQKGFTLIEMMIVVAIVGILASVAIPAYKQYTIRAQVSELVNMGGAAKSAVAEYHSNNGVLPADEAAANYAPQTGKFVSAISIKAGVITVTAGGSSNADIAAKTITMTPTADAASGGLTWACGGTMDAKYRPSIC